MIMRASDKRVAALDAMHESVVAQKIERAINRDRRWTVLLRRTVLSRTLLNQALDDLIGAERLVAGQQRFEHLTADRRQPLRARRAMRFGMRDCRAGASLMIVVGRWEDGLRTCSSSLGHSDGPTSWPSLMSQSSPLGRASTEECSALSGGSRKRDGSSAFYVAPQ